MTTRFTVTGKTPLTPTLMRVHLHTDDLSAFAESTFTDRYVKLVFPKPGTELPDDLNIRAMRASMPAEQIPDVRTYTALNPNVEAGTLDIDFVIHGDEGIAGPWAAQAKPGDTLLANGPGGAYRPNPDADWHLLVGDESAVPAITAALEALPADAVAQVVVVVDSPEHEPKLPLTSKSTLTFLHRNDPDAPSLESVVRGLEWLEGRAHAFVHGEAEETMVGLRPYLKNERGLERGQLSISGYWRRGRSEDGFREWKAALAKAEGEAEAGRPAA